MDRSFESGSAEDELAWHRAEASARKALRRFDRTTLRSFTQAVRAWRLAVLRDVATTGLAPPKWLKELPVGPTERSVEPVFGNVSRGDGSLLSRPW
jgi:hypothetical protein